MRQTDQQSQEKIETGPFGKAVFGWRRIYPGSLGTKILHFGLYFYEGYIRALRTV
jgi:hypothetical protein